ncbi:MAG: bifunctional demethylmenaquinone methyltransferase/2-methoxy-6-polyprenyl-1,4-benzoquinol methylase UbiE [Alphaproteobacteria bacterium]
MKKDNKTTFGFKDVDKNEKIGLVQGVFESVAMKYDIMNDLMSAGVHRLWKNTFIDMMKPNADMILLDVAGGTGDIAFRFLEGGGGNVTVCDLTEGMVKVGKNRALDKGIISNINWLVGNAQSLPLADNSVDVYSISFGLRNVADIDEALAEAHRVLKPSGRFMCLEFSHVVVPVLDKIYDEYSFKLLPKIGKIVADDEESYQYLVESIRRFPKQDELVAKMEKAGFSNATYTNLTGGISAIHSGYKI